MKIVTINNKEQVIRFNIGVLRRSAKVLGVKTPELFNMMSTGDMEAGVVMLSESIKATDRTFDVNTLDELSLDEYTKLIEVLMEEMTNGLPEDKEQAPDSVKKKK